MFVNGYLSCNLVLEQKRKKQSRSSSGIQIELLVIDFSQQLQNERCTDRLHPFGYKEKPLTFDSRKPGKLPIRQNATSSKTLFMGHSDLDIRLEDLCFPYDDLNNSSFIAPAPRFWTHFFLHENLWPEIKLSIFLIWKTRIKYRIIIHL